MSLESDVCDAVVNVLNAGGLGFTADKRYNIIGEQPSRVMLVSVRPVSIGEVSALTRRGGGTGSLDVAIVLRQQISDPNSNGLLESFFDKVEAAKGHLFLRDSVEAIYSATDVLLSSLTHEPYFDEERLANDQIIDCELTLTFDLEN